MTPEEAFDRIEAQIEKNTNGIRDLIVVSHTILTAAEKQVASQDKVTKQIKELREAQAGTDERLNILIDEVNRIIRALGKNGMQ